ncbi:MAG: choice-of-anchor Q domain-containing protein [Thermomicrobiales bacterium]
MSLLLRHARARGARWCAMMVLLVAALPSVHMGAMGTLFTATTVAELSADITAANTNPAQGPYTINLLAATVYTLTTEGATGSGTGLPAIVSGVDLTITGNGATIQRSTAVGTPDIRLFFITSGATLRLNTLTVRNGSVIGAAGTNGAPGSPGIAGGNAVGGAVFNGGMLVVSGSTFAGNRVVAGSGGKGGRGADATGTGADVGGAGGDAGTASGGAISNLGTLVVTGSVFSGNTARGGAGGAGGDGGNATGGPGGTGGNGGKGGTATGGAVSNAGTMTSTNSTLVANSATGGTGGDGGLAGTGTGSSDKGYGASGGMGQGGGIVTTFSGTLTVTNVTISGNGAVGGAGGTGFGGTLATASGTGGGLRTAGGNVTVKNTILTANSAASDGNCGNFVSDGGANIEYNPATTCGFQNPQTGDPLLGALVNHGGPTSTSALGPGSAAINTGNPTVCAGAAGAVDQRGLPRPVGQCSVGAFEPQPAPFPTLSVLSATSGATAGGSRVIVAGTGFVTGTSVAFGATVATTTFVSATALSVIVPAHAAETVDVLVTNPDRQAAALNLGYTFGTVTVLPVPQPTVPSIPTPRPLPGSPRPTAGPSGHGTPAPLPPRR